MQREWNVLIEAFARMWLSLHCAAIQGVNRGALFARSTAGSALDCLAYWPEGGHAPPELGEIAVDAIRGRQEVVRSRTPRGNGPGLRTLIAVPFSGGEHAGAVTVEVVHARTWDAEPSCKSVVDQLVAGLTYLELLSRGAATRRHAEWRVDLMLRALRREESREAATDVATELASMLACERVSIGWLENHAIEVLALSHSPRFDARAELVGDVRRLMEEAADQDAAVVVPALPGRPPRVALAHAEVAGRHGAVALCTVPLVRDGSVIGALTLERSRGEPFSEGEIAFCEETARCLGSALMVQRRAAEGPRERLERGMAEAWRKFRRPESEAKRLVAAAALVLVVFFCLATGTYRVTADATLEGRVQRAVVAGFDGYLAEARVRAGDVVREGQSLARLDDRDLALEKRRWEGRGAELARQYREAFASHDRSHMSIIKAQLDQASAQAALTEEKIARSMLTAPFAGIVVRGDLSQSLGTPVSQGDVLFEVAPLDGYRIILAVDERDITDVAPGQPGELVLSALPERPFLLRVERVIPISVAEDGRNTFRVEAELEAPVQDLRPGMEGVAKISVDRRRLLWIWTHDFVRWLQLKLWTLWT